MQDKCGICLKLMSVYGEHVRAGNKAAASTVSLLVCLKKVLRETHGKYL